MGQMDEHQLQLQLREAISLTIARRCASATDARAVADAAVSTFQCLSAQLTSVIGERGVEVLLRRALHLTSRRFGWLDLARERGDGTAPLSALKARLASGDAREVLETSEALLVTFTELLATLIGAPLAGRLMAPVWAVPPQETEP